MTDRDRESPFREPEMETLDNGDPGPVVAVGLAIGFCAVCVIVGLYVGALLS